MRVKIKMINENAVVAIVVTFKRKELLKQVINALINQSVQLHKIIIVDNNSCDGTEQEIMHLKKMLPDGDRIIYINTGDNLGGAGGFQFGFMAAEKYKYSHLWLMDDDLLPENNCLDNLLKSDITGIVQPMRFNKDDSCAEISPIDYNLKNPFLLRAKTRTVADIYDANEHTAIFNIHSVPFEGPLISRDVVSAIGRPNDKFFIFNDDLDYSLRAKNKGFKIYCNPNAKATRLLINNISSDLFSWKGYFMVRNYFYIMRTYGDNILVRMKPHWAIWVFLAHSIAVGRIANIKKLWAAYRDSKTLRNSKKYRP